MKTSNGVAIGQNIYGTLNISNFRSRRRGDDRENIFKIASVNGLGSDTIAIGKNICETTFNQTVSDSVLIGSDYATHMTDGKSVAIRSNVLNDSTCSNCIIAILLVLIVS